MERAGRLIASLPLPGDCLTPEDMARAAWPQAVGKRIAGRTRVASVRDGILAVEVEDKVWQAQLSTMRGQILGNLRKSLKKEVVTGIEFRIGIPRRQPAAAAHALRRPEDEADGIEDPVFRRLYIASRRKSSA